MKKNLLVTLADEKYVEQAKQVFSSVYWNGGWDGDYLLLAYEIPEKKLKWFRDKGILIKKIKLLSNREVGFNKHNPIVLSKFYLFTPYFRRWKNVVFLDADVIVRSSLDELAQVDKFSATHPKKRKLCMEFKNFNNIKQNKFKKKIKILRKKYTFRKLTFNSGIMAFPTDIIKENTFSEILEISKKYLDISHSNEETILNLYFYNKWKMLPTYYNFFPNIATDQQIRQKNINAVVLHFIKNKPWFLGNPFYEEWKKNLENAEKIDFKKIPKGKEFSRKEIKNYFKLIKKCRILEIIDRNIGRAGIVIKRISPKFYLKLKEKIK